MSASKRRPKKKMTLKISHKSPRNPIAKEVTKKRAGPMKDRRKEIDPNEQIYDRVMEENYEDEYDKE